MDRVAFLARLTRSRQAAGVSLPPEGDGSPLAAPTAAPPRGELVRRFLESASTAGAASHRVASEAEATAAARRLVRERGWRRVAGPPGMPPFAGGGTADPGRAEFGLEVADWAVAETGSVLVLSGPGADRRRSLLPPVSGFLVSADRILPAMGDALRLLDRAPQDAPSCSTFITGPSSTGDIAGHHIVGAHGPAEVVIWVIDP